MVLPTLLLVVSGLAWAEAPWRDRPIDPKVLTDGTAFTLDKGQWRLGLVHQDYGLLTNTTIGTSAPLFLLGVPHVRAKITAIQTPRFDASFQAGWYGVDLERFEIENASLTATPVAWTGSWTPTERLGIHFGTGWTMARAHGLLTAHQMGEGLAGLTGAEITEDLVNALGEEGGLYAGANLTLFRTHLQLEYRINRRDSVVFRSNAFVHLTALLAAGTAIDQEDADIEVGASARLSLPLRETLPAHHALSYQLSWERFHARVGLGLPLNNPFAWLNAVEMYWVLGPRGGEEEGEGSGDGS